MEGQSPVRKQAKSRWRIIRSLMPNEHPVNQTVLWIQQDCFVETLVLDASLNLYCNDSAER